LICNQKLHFHKLDALTDGTEVFFNTGGEAITCLSSDGGGFSGGG